jgi:two-component system, chemotaxis family, sensor kinase Cph1
VTLMGGAIGVNSREGNGSSFWFRIPYQACGAAEIDSAQAAKGETEAIAAAPGSVPQAEDQRERASVLVVDDNPVNLRVMQAYLEKLGCACLKAQNGREAVDFLATTEVLAVFMDCQMPVLDGYEATAEIRRREGDNRHTRIIAMTANALPADREKCLAAGMDDYLSKPVKLAQVKELLEGVRAMGGQAVAGRP